ncbi:hypothetical protein LEP1GSC088_0269 [Leptospira interrogans str. L1207]|nr:hypothetical protein LEP1GSC088_0269 [Leptospira interrogans str. L1207]
MIKKSSGLSTNKPITRGEEDKILSTLKFHTKLVIVWIAHCYVASRPRKRIWNIARDQYGTCNFVLFEQTRILIF